VKAAVAQTVWEGLGSLSNIQESLLADCVIFVVACFQFKHLKITPSCSTFPPPKNWVSYELVKQSEGFLLNGVLLDLLLSCGQKHVFM